MRYIVIDNLSREEREYNNVNDAYKDAEKYNGILIRVDDNGDKKIIENFS